MKQRVTIIPADKAIIVDGSFLSFDFIVTGGVHAIQWKNGAGFLEFVDGTVPSQKLEGQTDYETYVASYVNMWKAEQERLVAEAIKPLPLEEAAARKQQEIVMKYEASFAPIEAIYPRTEREGWAVQEAEAKALQENPDAVTPVLSALVAQRNRGETVAELAHKVLANAKTWCAVYGLLTGQQQRMFAELQALVKQEGVTSAAVLAYAVEYQLPQFQ